MNCDSCKWCERYYDRCTKFGCEVDGRSVHNCFEAMDMPVLDYMISQADDSPIITKASPASLGIYEKEEADHV